MLSREVTHYHLCNLENSGDSSDSNKSGSNKKVQGDESHHSIIHINDAIDELLDYAMEGTCRPLKV